MAQTTINNGDTGLVARTAINANFTELYSGSMTFANSIRIGQFLSSASQAETSLYIGVGAGVTTTSTTSRRGNVAIGTGAMANLTNGSNFYDGAYSVAIGYNAMNLMTTGGYNTAVGYKALESNQTNIQNTAIGYFALRLKTANGGSTAVGYAALAQESTGYENTAIGRTALTALTTGFRNVAVSQCLQALTTGNYNVVGGSESYERLTTQSQNTGWGHWTGVYNRGAGNTSLGYLAIGQTTLDSAGNNASYNTVIGNLAGRFLAVGDYNTWIGYDTGSSSTSDDFDNTVAIGKATKVTESNSFVLGGTIDANANNYGFGGESYGGGSRVIFIKNAVTVPTTDPTAGGILYTEGGALKFRGSSGTVTTIANA